MNIVSIIVFVVAFLFASWLINALQKLLMKITGADVMFFDSWKKLMIILLVAYALMEMVLKLFGMG